MDELSWISARDALTRDFQRNGANLIDLAADGLVRSRAAALTSGRAPAERDAELSTNFWRAMQRLTGSAYRDWKTGTFKTGIPSFTGLLPAGAQRAVGVTFEKGDLDAHLPASGGGAARSPSVATAKEEMKPRGRPRANGWDAWIAELALAVHDGDVAGSMRADQLIDLINLRLTKSNQDEMPRTTVQSAVDSVLRAFRAAH
jgi:hypothetical protein